MFFKSDAKIKSRLREVESRVKLGSSSDLQEDLEFLAHNYSAMGAWDKAHAVTQHMVSLAEGNADANLSIWEAVDDTLPAKNRHEHQRLIIGLCIIVATISLTLGGLSKISPKQIADLRCAVFPNDSQSLCQRANLELRQGDFAAAMADCDQALIAQPQNKDAFHIKANTFDWQGDLESADHFNELSDKTQADYWRSKSYIEYMRGQYKDAAFDAHQAGMIDKYYFDFTQEEYDWALTGDKDKALAAALLSETYAKTILKKLIHTGA